MKADLILSIESSCDDSSVALVRNDGFVQLQFLESQISRHQSFGGVVPEVAARLHAERLSLLVSEALKKAPKENLKAIAATSGPGLIGPLLVGKMLGEGVAKGLGLPFIGVHHLRGHLASVLLYDGTLSPQDIESRKQEVFPALCLLASGGHTQLLIVNAELEVELCFSTLDDAAGECFDKGAKLLGLNYPGGPSIEKLIEESKNLNEYSENFEKEYFLKLPHSKIREGYSFSGLKTALALLLSKDSFHRAEVAGAFEKVIVEQLIYGLTQVMKSQLSESHNLKSLILCGGVAANKLLRKEAAGLAKKYSLNCLAPLTKYSTDNAAMIGMAAWIQNPKFNLLDVEARIPLDS